MISEEIVFESGLKREIVFEGLETSSNAFISLFNGENFGKTLVNFLATDASSFQDSTPVAIATRTIILLLHIDMNKNMWDIVTRCGTSMSSNMCFPIHNVVTGSIGRVYHS